MGTSVSRSKNNGRCGEDSPDEFAGSDKEKEFLTTSNGDATGAHTQIVDGTERLPVLPRVFKRRWIILLLFCAYSLSNAYQWIHLVIITNILHKYYNESLPGSEYQQNVGIQWLSMVYMLAYIPLIFPATWLLDRKGLRVVALLATSLNALGAWIKCAAVSPDRFFVLMFGQTVCAVAQIFVLGIPARLAAVWFGPNEVSTATAMGVFGNQLGCAVGFLIPPEIVPNADDLDAVGHRLSIMMYGTAAVTTLLFVLVIFVFKKEPPVPPSQAQAAAVEAASREDYLGSLRKFFSNRGFVLLMITYGVNTGSYYAIGTLLNPIVIDYFPGQEANAGRIGLTLVVAGVGGSIIAGLWLDRTKLFKSTTVFIYAMSFIFMLVFTFILDLDKIWIVFLCSGALGFFMTGYLPVGFEFAVEITYPESEGTSSGLLNASAQVFGIVFTMGMGAVMDNFGTLPANLVLAGALLFGTAGTVLVKSDLRRQAAGRQFLQALSHKLEIQVEPLVSQTSNDQTTPTEKRAPLADGGETCV